jgi:hypothetical protein
MRHPVGWPLGAVALLWAASSTATGAIPCWSALESGASRLTIDIDVAEPSLTSGAVQVADFPGLDLVGTTWVPTLSLPIAVPPDGAVSIQATVEGLHPIALVAAEGEAMPEAPPSSRQPADALGFVDRGEPSWAADLRLVTLRVFALRPGSEGEWLVPTRIRIECIFTAGALPAAGNRAAAPGSGMRCAVAVNARQAELWRRVPVAPAGLTRGDGFDSTPNPWLRVSIARRGLYEITAGALDSAGIDVGDIDLGQLRLFCAPAGARPDTLGSPSVPEWMEPCALLIEDDGDQAWDAATRVYFLGNGPDGWRSDLDLAPPDTLDRHYSHPYARTFTYWLTWGGDFSTAPLRMAQEDASPGGRPTLEVAAGRIHHEENHVYATRPREESLDWPRFFAVEVGANRGGVGASVTVPVSGLGSDSTATVRVALWGNTWAVSGPNNDHSAYIKFNGTEIASGLWESLTRRVLIGETKLRSSNSVALYVRERPDGTELISDEVLMDWAEIDYAKRLAASRDSLEFWAPAVEASAHAYRVTGLTSADGWLLLDGSSFRQPRRLQPQVVAEGTGYAAEFSVAPAGEAAHLVLTPRDRAAHPAAVERVSWAGGWLRQRTDAIDYLIVTTAALSDPAGSLARHRTQHFYGAEGDTVMLGRVAQVDIQQVFDEFSWGQHDPVALRDFIAYARLYWKGSEAAPTLSHVMLLGNAYYDARDYLRAGSEDLIPAYLWYTWEVAHSPQEMPEFYGDDWFGLLDGPRDMQVDLNIGRLPAANESQAWTMVRKIIANEVSAERDAWRTRLLFTADDICQGNQPDGLSYAHMAQSEHVCNEVAPVDAVFKKIYLYEYGAECRYDRKPQSTADLLDIVAEGVLLFNFVGHGSEVQLATERLLDLSTVSSLSNTNRPFLMVTASCAVGRFAEGGDGLGVQVMCLSNRGALGVISATATASSYSSHTLNYGLVRALFPERRLLPTRAFGPALVQAKWYSVNDRNDVRYNLLGDPGSRFAVPDGSVEVHLEGVPEVPADSDTLLRGAPALVRGRVLDATGVPEVTFSGQAEVQVLDSDILRQPVSGAPGFDYLLPGSRIFSGTVPVTDGEFECPFFVPTALRSGARGDAHIYVYAKRTSGGVTTPVRDAAGARPSLFIPEEREPSSSDTVGPTIDLAWANADAPVEIGSEVTAELSDSSGIYVAALTPSRSVVVTVADRDGRLLVAQDLASAVEFGTDYRHASLTYALPTGLPSGQRLTLRLAASDNLGRRTAASLEFHIGDADTLQVLLQGVYNIPNPSEGATRFLFEIGREADLEVTIYTVTGHRILRLSGGTLAPVRAREVGIPWDGRDEDGDPVANGLYFYRARATDDSGRREERIERLVVLR